MSIAVKNTVYQLARQVECAKQAGIYDNMFLAFGALLGCVREHGMIDGDDDLDVGFIRENITAEQEREYVRLIGEPTIQFPNHGLFEYRRREEFRQDDGRHFWLSVRGKPQGECFKCCHWFFWKQYGYAWHCKGRDSLVKGMPGDLLSIGGEVNFYGVTIHVPKYTGSILDFWYADWHTKRLGSNSAKKIIMDVSSWVSMDGTIKAQ